MMQPDDAFLLGQELPPGHRSGFVAVLGRPNVGKSTLVNALVGEKVAIVSSKPQTTRNRLLGILTREDAQVIFIDTPGIHRPLHRLGEVMVETATSAVPDADVLLWVVDVSAMPADEDRQVAAVVAGARPAIPAVLALNKVDRLTESGVGADGRVPEHADHPVMAYRALLPDAPWVLCSAVRGDNLDVLLGHLVSSLPLGPRLYPADEFTDQQQRFMAGELIREQALRHLRDEVPHAVAVAVNEFKPRSESLTFISAVIYTERESQKAILLGKEGQMLKAIGQGARLGIEELLGVRVYLELWVKVRPKWRTKDEELRRLGYVRPKRGAAKGGADRSRS